MTIELTDEERSLLGFHLACRLEDYEKEIKKAKPEFRAGATKQFRQLEKLIYTKVIPDSWCGPKPRYWDEV
jgi:hypothetical protein